MRSARIYEREELHAPETLSDDEIWNVLEPRPGDAWSSGEVRPKKRRLQWFAV